MTVVDSETPTQSSASGHVFLVYALTLFALALSSQFAVLVISELSPCLLFPAGLSCMCSFFSSLSSLLLFPADAAGSLVLGGREPCVEFET